MLEKIFEFREANIPEKYVATYDWKNRKTDYLTFMRCQRLTEKKEYDLFLEIEGPTRLAMRFDVLYNTFSSPLLSKKAVDVLSNLCAKEFQAFPARIKALDGIIDSYKILNLLEEVGPINFKKTDCRYFDDGDVAGIEKLVMQPHAMNSCHIGRLKDMKPIILVSETVQKAFKKAKIKAIQFREIEMA